MKKIDDAERFPIWKISGGVILSKRGDLSVVFEVSLPELFSLSTDGYEAFHQSWVRALRSLSEGTIFHKQDWFIQETYQAGFNPEKGFLSHASERHFNERPYLNHTCYIILTKMPSGKKGGSVMSSSLFSTHILPRNLSSPLFKAAFLDECASFERLLKDSPFLKVRRLEDSELASTQTQAGLLERYTFLQTGSQVQGIRDMSLENDFRIGNKHCLMYTLADTEHMPGFCGSRVNYDAYTSDTSKFPIGFASPLGLLLPCDHILNQYVIIDSKHEVVKKLEATKTRMHSMSSISRQNAFSEEFVNDYLNEIVADQRMPVQAHFNILAWSEDKHRLKDTGTLIESALRSMEATPKLETVDVAQIYIAGLAGNAADLPQEETFHTFAEQASCFFNLESCATSSLSPVGIRFGDRLTGKPIHVDISDEPMERGWTTNRNKFIIGPSGSGKSFFTNHFVRTYYEQGSHIVLVDVGHSYKGLCEMVGGYYFTYDEKKPLAFNPFYSGEGALDTEKKENLKNMLFALWKQQNQLPTRAEYVALSNAVMGYYQLLAENQDLFPCFNTFYEYLGDQFSEQVMREGVKDQHFDLHNFLFVLRPYYRGGEFDYLLNAQTQLDILNERFIVFELDNIKDHPILFPVVTLMIMDVFLEKIRKIKGVRKVILIEEAWKAIAKEGMADYIKYLFKTVRKHFGEAVVVTQEINDIISSPIIKETIIDSSDCKILLDQSKYEKKFDAIQKLLGLSDKERELILSINKNNDPTLKYKEVFISLGGVRSAVYRTEVSEEEYLTYTTEQKEKMEVFRRADALGGNLELAIRQMAEEMRS